MVASTTGRRDGNSGNSLCDGGEEEQEEEEWMALAYKDGPRPCRRGAADFCVDVRGRWKAHIMKEAAPLQISPEPPLTAATLDKRRRDVNDDEEKASAICLSQKAMLLGRSEQLSAGRRACSTHLYARLLDFSRTACERVSTRRRSGRRTGAPTSRRAEPTKTSRPFQSRQGAGHPLDTGRRLALVRLLIILGPQQLKP